jgi:hypothetical protein
MFLKHQIPKTFCWQKVVRFAPLALITWRFTPEF